MKNKFFISVYFWLTLTFLIPPICQADSSYGYSNPLPHNSLTSFLEGLLVSIQGIAGWLAVIFIVIGGVMYLTAGGKDSQLTLAKNTIVTALIGFSLAIAGPSLLKEIKDLIASGGAGGTGANAIDNANSISRILTNLLDFALTLIGILALISLIYSGITYLSAGGNRENSDKAKKIALYSIIALAVSGGSLILVKTILSFLNV